MFKDIPLPCHTINILTKFISASTLKCHSLLINDTVSTNYIEQFMYSQYCKKEQTEPVAWTYTYLAYILKLLTSHILKHMYPSRSTGVLWYFKNMRFCYSCAISLKMKKKDRKGVRAVPWYGTESIEVEIGVMKLLAEMIQYIVLIWLRYLEGNSP